MIGVMRICNGYNGQVADKPLHRPGRYNECGEHAYSKDVVVAQLALILECCGGGGGAYGEEKQ